MLGFARRHTDIIEPQACSPRPSLRPRVLNRVGEKWSVLVIVFPAGRRKRLRRTLEGVSERMLSLTLKGLRRDGMVSGTAFPAVPPRVEFELIVLGRARLKPLRGPANWAAKREKIQTARQRPEAANSNVGPLRAPAPRT